MINDCLSLQDVFWRTIHGNVWLLSRRAYHNDPSMTDFFNDLKSVCKDVLKAEAVGNFTGFTLLKNNTITVDTLQQLKELYQILFDYTAKVDTGTATTEDLSHAINTVTTLSILLRKETIRLHSYENSLIAAMS